MRVYRLRVFAAIGLLWLIFCANDVQAQTDLKPTTTYQQRDWKAEFQSRRFLESSAVYWSGVIVDFHSSQGLKEKNPVVRGANGQISPGKYFALNGGIYGFSLLVQKFNPSAAHWVRRVGGVIHFGVAVRNYGMR